MINGESWPRHVNSNIIFLEDRNLFVLCFVSILRQTILNKMGYFAQCAIVWIHKIATKWRLDKIGWDIIWGVGKFCQIPQLFPLHGFFRFSIDIYLFPWQEEIIMENISGSRIFNKKWSSLECSPSCYQLSRSSSITQSNFFG